jgi:hypothetical protein
LEAAKTLAGKVERRVVRTLTVRLGAVNVNHLTTALALNLIVILVYGSHGPGTARTHELLALIARELRAL